MEGYQWSLNVVFAQLGALVVKGPRLADYARRFGFGQPLGDVGIPIATSQLASDPSFLDSPKAVGATSYGQGQVQATALQMALVAATVAHGGAVPAPYVVQQVVNPATGAVMLSATPHDLDRAVSSATAATLQQMMITSVQKGYASGGAVPGATVGGKTGTANKQEGHGYAAKKYRGVFAGLAPIDAPRIAVAVMIDEPTNGQYFGGDVAAPVFSQAVQQTLRVLGVAPDMTVKPQVVTDAVEESF